MSIISFWFFVFVLASLVAYVIVRPHFRWVVLLVASGVFFVLGCGWKLYCVFLLQVLLAFAASLCMETSGKTRRRVIVYIAVSVEIGILIALKNSSFFIINARIMVGLWGKQSDIPFLMWAAPLGISYYTLMLVGYLLDVYWGKTSPQRNFSKLVLFAGFFPQMVSGPITRINEMKEGLYGPHRFDLTQIQLGAQRFLWGLFKKLVISERLGVVAHFIYGGELAKTTDLTGAYVWIAAFAYMFQLYTDFSGCMDIVIGTAQMFGVRLPENFYTPFYATSLAEFWRRWHMTLGVWGRDYIMYPFLKSTAAAKLRKSIAAHFGRQAANAYPTYLGTLLVWLYIGFWHGGSYKWIFWGVTTCGIIIGGMLFKPLFDRVKALLHINTAAWSWTLFGRLRTAFLFMVVGSVQPAASLGDAFKMWKGVLEYNPWVFVDGSLYKLGLDRPDFWVAVFGLLVLAEVSKLQQQGSVRAMIAKQNIAFRWMLWLLLFTAVLLFGMYGEGYNPADFVYGGF